MVDDETLRWSRWSWCRARRRIAPCLALTAKTRARPFPCCCSGVDGSAMRARRCRALGAGRAR